MAKASSLSARVYADTSFLFSLYVRDANTAAATTWLLEHRPALVFTPWQGCELRNAIRLAVARGNTTPTVALQALADVAADSRRGDLVETGLAWAEVFAVAEGLSAAHTTSLAVRTLDLLHVAAALSLRVATFVTFDARQRALAQAAGLRIAVT